MECGGQCVMVDGTAVMQQFCADNWGSLDQVLHNFGLSNCFLPPINSIMLIFCLVISVLYGHQYTTLDKGLALYFCMVWGVLEQSQLS